MNPCNVGPNVGGFRNVTVNNTEYFKEGWANIMVGARPLFHLAPAKPSRNTDTTVLTTNAEHHDRYHGTGCRCRRRVPGCHAVYRLAAAIRPTGE